jgi:hypothetical protein
MIVGMKDKKQIEVAKRLSLIKNGISWTYLTRKDKDKFYRLAGIVGMLCDKSMEQVDVILKIAEGE